MLVPTGAKDEAFSIRVVTSIVGNADDCASTNYEGCVVARRALNFIPHSTLHLPIVLEASCLGVPCDATKTCHHGVCVSATINNSNGCLQIAGCELGIGGASNANGGTSAQASIGGATVATGGVGPTGSSALPVGGSVASGGVAGFSSTSNSGTSSPSGGITSSTGGAPATGGTTTNGGSSATGRTYPTGGAPATGGAVATGGTRATGGTLATGGALATGGTAALGGSGANPAFTVGHYEVAQFIYGAWLGSNPVSSGQIAECAWNSSFTPTCNWSPASTPFRPVVCVDWCDAYAFCSAFGLRLCGNVAGGSNDFSLYADASQSAWYRLCTSVGLHPFPYGDAYASTTCNGFDAGNQTTVDIGSMASCRAGDPGANAYFDMSGNVMEWEDSCRSSDDHCRLRGGSFNGATPASLACAADASAPRNTMSSEIGFRCCPLP